MAEEKTTGPEKVPVHVALARVMADVKAVRKEGFNANQKYNFRGIDGVMNAVGPALRTHGVLPTFTAEMERFEKVAVGNGRAQTQVLIRYVLNFIGPAGDQLPQPYVSYGEATDYQDKATAKAHSVAYRTALLQALCLPTDDRDPDEYSDPVHVAQAQNNPQASLMPLTEIESKMRATENVDELKALWLEAGKHGEAGVKIKTAINKKATGLMNDGTQQSG